MLYDKLGQELLVGDLIAYPANRDCIHLGIIREQYVEANNLRRTRIPILIVEKGLYYPLYDYRDLTVWEPCINLKKSNLEYSGQYIKISFGIVNDNFLRDGLVYARNLIGTNQKIPKYLLERTLR